MRLRHWTRSAGNWCGFLAAGAASAASRSAAAIVFSVVLAASSVVALAAEAGAPIQISPGQTVRAEMPRVDPYETGAIFEMVTGRTGWLTIEARSLEFDTFLVVSRVDHEGTATLARMDNNGGEGTNSRAFIEAAFGERYRIELQPEFFPYCGGAFELSVTPGRPRPLYEDPVQDEAYRDAVRARAEERNTTDCRVRALLVRAGEISPILTLVPWDGEERAAAEEALALAQERLGPDHPALIESLERIAIGHLKSLALEESKALLQRALEVAEERFGADHYVAGRILYLLEIVLFRLGEKSEQDYEEACALMDRAVAIQERTLGPGHPVLALKSGGMEWLLPTGWGETDYVRTIIEDAEAVLKRTYGPDHPEYSGILWWIGVDTFFYVDMFEGLPVFERMLDITERAYGEESVLLKRPMGVLANAYGMMGDDIRFMSLWERTLRLVERVHGPDHPQVVWPLCRVAMTYTSMGEYERAKVLLDRANSIIDASPGPVDVHVRGALTYWYMATGDYEAARPLRQRGLEAAEETYGADNVWTVWPRMGVAHLLWVTGDHEGAEALVRRCVQIVEGSWWPDYWVAGVLDAFAELLLRKGHLVEARQQVDRVLAIHEELYGDRRPPPADTLMKLARAHAGMGEHTEAFDAALRSEQGDREFLRSVISGGASERQALGYASSRVPAMDLTLSLLEVPALDGADATRRAWDALIRSRAVVLDEMAARRQIVARAGRLTQLAEEFSTATRRCLNLSMRDPQPDQLEKHLELLEKTCIQKERAEKALADTSASFREKKAREAVGWAAVVESLPPGSALVAFALYDRHDFTASAQPETARPTAPPGEAEQPGEPETVAVGAAPAGEPVRSYMALVRGTGAADPVAVPLGPAAEIDALVAAWQEEVRRGALQSEETSGESEQGYRRAGEALRRRLWDPLAAHVEDGRRVFVVADGSINLVSLASLPIRGNEYLLEKGPVIHYVSAERDLVPSGLETPRDLSLLALGGPDFEAKTLFAALTPAETGSAETAIATDVARLATPAEDPIPSGAAAATPAQTETTATGVATPAPAQPREITSPGSEAPSTTPGGTQVASLASFRGERSACGAFSALEFDPLPAAGREVDEIASLWKKAGGGRSASDGGRVRDARAVDRETAASEAGRTGRRPEEVLRLSGAAASETAFKEHAPGHRVLHLATHGFFLGGRCESMLERQRGFGRVVVGNETPTPPPVKGEHPLVLSGLALAGANHREHVGEDEDDGILTAQEIAAMDLSGVEWAVLSACDTGVGEIKAGEGVFGLRRAFQVAGADTLIMSLWSVEDEAARAWMEALYEGRLQWSLDTAEAAHQASLTVLNDRRERGLSDHPFYWAGFVAAGDWR